MTYTYENRKKIKVAIKEAEKEDCESLSKSTQKKLREAKRYLDAQRAHVKELLKKPVRE